MKHITTLIALALTLGTLVPLAAQPQMTAKEKRLAYEKIANHEADIIIGTHALIQSGKLLNKKQGNNYIKMLFALWKTTLSYWKPID